mmetsp:Transcript_15376/g.36392  ORF Transcript_15376/g.36392 Transcript_15376/m.36392 type:complete len:292 (+) Transcript_15376:276-1151(+)
MEAVVVDPSMPPSIYLVALVRQQDNAAVLVLARQLILGVQALLGEEGFGESLDFFMPRRTFDRERRGLRLAAECHRLDFDEVRHAQRNELGVVCRLLHVVSLDQSQTIHRPLLLRGERLHGVQVPLPEVREKRPVHRFQRLFRASINTDVELRDGLEVSNRFWKLCICDQESADLSLVQLTHKLIDPRIHNWLAHKREGAMPDCHRLVESILLHARNALAFPDHPAMLVDALSHNLIRRVHGPLPLRSYWVLVVAPTEHALVRTRQRGSSLHALVRGDPIERMLVASTPAS